nr:hypothetical protein Iba_chr01dCG2820 [Ipomoea batatas]
MEGRNLSASYAASSNVAPPPLLLLLLASTLKEKGEVLLREMNGWGLEKTKRKDAVRRSYYEMHLVVELSFTSLNAPTGYRICGISHCPIVLDPYHRLLSALGKLRPKQWMGNSNSEELVVD